MLAQTGKLAKCRASRDLVYLVSVSCVTIVVVLLWWGGPCK